ncbi:hypothetical protein MSAN_01156400 [Mycena sanguinolenta]|uniref:Uncharacterized protein n=1 Tax=Mycena sanguinolenta TaxID=230812 RepID=A0A8H7D729_9AGAR|nr:hypothetical protein MSAN_01156400 [Mycena sanguinolenta]
MNKRNLVVTYSSSGCNFEKVFTETSLDEIKETVREHFLVSDFTLSYDVGDATSVRLQTDSDFRIFQFRSLASAPDASVIVRVKIPTPSHASASNVAGLSAATPKGEILRTRLVEFLHEACTNPPWPDQNFFMVKGTAGSGKTILCGQLYNYLVDKGARVSIINCNQWNRSALTSSRRTLNAFVLRGPQIDADDRQTRHWVLLDDAQCTFKDPALWIYFKDAPRNLLFIVFALSIPRWRGLAIDGSQNQIQAHERIELKPAENGLQWSHSRHIPGLYFVAEEYQELLEYHKQHEELPALAVDLKGWVFEASAGHIGAITSIFNAIKSAAGRLQLQEMSMSTFLGSYRSPEEALMDCSRGEAFNRGLPAPTHLQGEGNIHLLKIFRDIISANGPLAFPLYDDIPLGPQQAHDRGWLTWEYEGPDRWYRTSVVVLDFPSLLHRSRLSYQLLGCQPLDPQVEAMTLLDFVGTVVSFFSAGAMVQPARQSQSAGCHSLPSISFPEAQWLNEFRRGVSTVTGGRGVWLSPEFGTGKASGRIDFFVMGSKKWGIQLLREGDSLEDHLARFEQGGAYYGWIEGGTMQDYVVLNFGTHVQARTPLLLHPNLYHVTFDDQFEYYAVADNMLNVVKSGTLVA